MTRLWSNVATIKKECWVEKEKKTYHYHQWDCAFSSKFVIVQSSSRGDICLTHTSRIVRYMRTMWFVKLYSLEICILSNSQPQQEWMGSIACSHQTHWPAWHFSPPKFEFLWEYWTYTADWLSWPEQSGALVVWAAEMLILGVFQ